MITAHPDDEALFGGAELLTHPKEYKVVVVDEYHSKIRRKEFKASMKFIGIKEYEHWTGYKGGEDYHREKLIYELLRVLREREYIKIVTHNKVGEYGHPRHRALHDILNVAMNGEVTEDVPASVLQNHDNVKVFYCD